MANRCSKWCAIVIFVCMCWSRATSRGVPTTNKLMSKSQCHELSKLLRQQSVATVRRFLSDHKISATQKTCVGSTCEGGECCRCCSHGRCSTVQEWANDLGITASLSSVKHPATPKKTGWGHYHPHYLDLLARRSHLIQPYLSYILFSHMTNSVIALALVQYPTGPNIRANIARTMGAKGMSV